MNSIQYKVLLFRSVSETMKAESVMQKRCVRHKIIPIPRQISSDCGICIRVELSLCDDAVKALDGNVRIDNIVDL